MLGKASSVAVLGCEGAIDSCTIGRISGGGLHRIFVNDVEIDESPSFFGEGEGRNLQQILKEDFNVDVIGLDENQNITTDRNYIEIARFKNNSADYVQLRIGYIDADFVTDQYPPLNPTLSFLGDVSFCLAPK